jgi:hypothetical protein
VPLSKSFANEKCNISNYRQAAHLLHAHAETKSYHSNGPPLPLHGSVTVTIFQNVRGAGARRTRHELLSQSLINYQLIAPRPEIIRTLTVSSPPLISFLGTRTIFTHANVSSALSALLHQWMSSKSTLPLWRMKRGH